MARKWVKIVGSDVQIECPQRRVDSHSECSCDYPFHPHWHYEDDPDGEPTRRLVPPVLLEDNGDGTYTSWGFTLWGPVGAVGTLASDVGVQPVGPSDMEHVQRKEAMILAAVHSQGALATAIRIARGREL